MHTRSVIGGLLLATGLLSGGCGSTELEMEPAENISQAEQALAPCPPNMLSYYGWDCDSNCGSYWGKALHLYCMSRDGSDTWDMGIVQSTCEPCN
jgi:hypothetical protein